MRIQRKMAVVSAASLMAIGATGAGAQTSPGHVMVHSAHSTNQPKTVFQCKQRYRPGTRKRASCIKRVASEKPGSSCAHPIKSGINFDTKVEGIGVVLTYKPVQFPPHEEGTPPPGWADFTMGPVTTVMHTDLFYATFGWKLITSKVALCRAVLYESLPHYFRLHEKALPNRTQAQYNIALVDGYTFGLTLFERYIHG
jgi:hypothetical protein